jgi:hypothetical protein
MFGKLVLVGWLLDAGKDVIFVQNTETNRVQKITSEATRTISGSWRYTQT